MADQFWLVSIDQHGVPSLQDGPHDSVSAVERALFIIQTMGLCRDVAKWACARVTLTDVEAKSGGVDLEFVDACRQMMHRVERTVSGE